MAYSVTWKWSNTGGRSGESSDPDESTATEDLCVKSTSLWNCSCTTMYTPLDQESD